MNSYYCRNPCCLGMLATGPSASLFVPFSHEKGRQAESPGRRRKWRLATGPSGPIDLSRAHLARAFNDWRAGAIVAGDVDTLLDAITGPHTAQGPAQLLHLPGAHAVHEQRDPCSCSA
jgi:hypothetical protein